MIKQNLHTHSHFSDGKNTCEEMILAAMAKGFTALGFSEHAYTPYDLDCCIKQADIPAYFKELSLLKQKYKGQIEIYTGFECDSFYNTDKTGLDYTIGSVHYVFDENSGKYFTVDYDPQIFENALRIVADGNLEKLVGIYYDNLTRFALEYRPDIIGHMDLIKKLNTNNRYFDPKCTWYQRILDETVEKIAKSGCIVEINTGAMYRNKLTEPYPSPEILSRLLILHVPVIVSSDAHNIESIDFYFDEAEKLLKKTGYRSIKQLTADGFVDVEI